MIINKYKGQGGGGVAGVSSLNGQTGALTTKTINGNDILGTGDITIEGGEAQYDLPIASSSTLGGIKVGNGLSIDADGVLSAKVVSLSQSDYDALVQAGTVDANTLYVII